MTETNALPPLPPVKDGRVFIAGVVMRFTARQRLESWAHASRVQTDEVTYGMRMDSAQSDVNGGGCADVDGARMADIPAVAHAARARGVEMTRSADVVRLSGDEYDRLQDAADVLRSYRVLRIAVDAMVAPLGHHGTISARDDRVSAVMDALAQVDEIERNER